MKECEEPEEEGHADPSDGHLQERQSNICDVDCAVSKSDVEEKGSPGPLGASDFEDNTVIGNVTLADVVKAVSLMKPTGSFKVSIQR